MATTTHREQIAGYIPVRLKKQIERVLNPRESISQFVETAVIAEVHRRKEGGQAA